MPLEKQNIKHMYNNYNNLIKDNFIIHHPLYTCERVKSKEYYCCHAKYLTFRFIGCYFHISNYSFTIATSSEKCHTKVKFNNKKIKYNLTVF